MPCTTYDQACELGIMGIHLTESLNVGNAKFEFVFDSRLNFYYIGFLTVIICFIKAGLHIMIKILT